MEIMCTSKEPQSVNCSSSSSSKTQALNDEILDCLVRFQSVCDNHRASIQFQDDLLRVLFEGLGHSKGKKSIHGPNKKCLASLLTQKATDWDGQLNNTQIPFNFSQMVRLYQKEGMVIPQDWKLCIGTEEISHDPLVLEPSLEDVIEGETIKCTCDDVASQKLLKRDCDKCCERCSKCNNRRKEMIQFQYISIIDQLRALCSSESYCHEFLAMWRAKSRWLGKQVAECPEYIHEYWDGEKVRIYQQFWNPDDCWEAPVICSNQYCKMTYRAFPENHKSRSLLCGWREEFKKYKFRCIKCNRWIEEEKKFIKVILIINYYLLCIW